MYLSNNLPAFSKLLHSWIQLLLFGLVVYSSASRVLDHRHHASDVVVGALFGAGIGAIAALTIKREKDQILEVN